MPLRSRWHEKSGAWGRDECGTGQASVSGGRAIGGGIDGRCGWREAGFYKTEGGIDIAVPSGCNQGCHCVFGMARLVDLFARLNGDGWMLDGWKAVVDQIRNLRLAI